MVYQNLSTENLISTKIFDNKPSIKEIINFIASKNLDLMDNDREFCYLFDIIALNNGYTEQNLPPYWSIGREIFRYKKENNLSAKEKTNQISLSIKLLDLKKYNVKIVNPCAKKISTARIIDVIWNNYNYAFENDRLLVKVFDCIAINNGFRSEELPKYWNIIRAAFDYKKDKEPIKQNKTVNYTINKSNKGIPIDYRVLEVDIDELGIEQKLKNKLKSFGLNTINDILTVNSEFYKENRINGFKKTEIFAALINYNIEPDTKYIPSIITLPDIYFKKLDRIFDIEIMQVLNKYHIRNVGLLANQFPDLLINDEQLIENPKVFEYIDKITKILNKHGISDCPINLSKFQIEDLNRLTMDELLEINYTDKIIDCINKAFCGLSIKEQDVLSARNGLYNEFKAKSKTIPDEILSTIDFMFSDDNIEHKQAPEKKNLFVENKKYTLDEIGQEFGVTRERIRQIENKAIKKFNTQFQEQFQKYYNALSQILENKQSYILISHIENLKKYESITNLIYDSYENIVFYIDFSVGLIIKNGITLESLLEDDTVPANIKQQIEKYIYRNYITIDNKKIKDNRIEILNYYLMAYCRKPQNFNEIQNSYMDMLITNNLSHRTDLLYDDSTLYNRLTSLNYVLLSPGKVLRYYSPEGIEKIVNSINLKKYHNIEISARKLYLDNIDLMEKYEIYNEYELHNLLKKNINNQEIDFARMPTIRFGNVNKKNQVLELLKMLSPISYMDLAKAYEDEYGVDTSTFCANYLDYISKYLVDGKYTLEADIMSESNLNILKNALTEDFYWKEDLEDIYQKLIGDANLKDLNSYNLGKLNYSMASTCIYSKKYSSLSDFIKHFLSQDIVNMKNNSRLRSIQTFYAHYSEFKNNLDIIEFSPDIYINIKKLNSAGISKDILIDYQNKVKNYCEDKFFTIYSLRNQGFKYDVLDNLGFEDYFYSSILINDKEIQSKKILNVYLMKKDNRPFDIADFLIYVMGKLRKIDIYDLCDYIKKQYNLDINRYKIVAISKECSLYYNQITEKVYLDYNEFFNEI